MEILASVDMHFLVGITLVLVVICLVYYSVAKKQGMLMYKLEISLKHFEQMNQQLALLLNEQRRANRLLSEVAGIEMPPYSPAELNMNMNMNTNMAMGAAQTNSSYGTSRMSSANDMNDGLELNSQTKLYVGNIDYSATEAELAAHFSRFGQVEFVNIPVNRYTGRARGFGFVTFISKESAERAITLNGSEFKGRQIQVNFAKERDLVQ